MSSQPSCLRAQKALKAATAFKDKWDINLDVDEFTCNSEVDCSALFTNYDQLAQDFGLASTLLLKLP